MANREYQYVGPEEILEVAKTQPSGTPVLTREDISAWLETDSTERLPDGAWIATFTVGTDQVLYLAPRRSEHVACAAGGPVLAAGEITIDAECSVTDISNQSTGFCPEPESWTSVELVLERIGLDHPGEFTTAVIFRLCPKCHERNIVKDSWFHCQLCDAKLTDAWNFSTA